MSGGKIVLVVLVLLGAIFVVGLGIGVHFNRKGKSVCDENTNGEECSRNCRQANCIPSWTARLGDSFASLRPRVQIADLSVTDRRVLLSAIQPTRPPVTITIPAAEKSFFKPSTRTATFRLATGLGTEIIFSAEAPEEIEELRQQRLKLPRTEKSKPDDDLLQGSLAITQKGGTLLITCIGTIPCELELK